MKRDTEFEKKIINSAFEKVRHLQLHNKFVVFKAIAILAFITILASSYYK